MEPVTNAQGLFQQIQHTKHNHNIHNGYLRPTNVQNVCLVTSVLTDGFFVEWFTGVLFRLSI